MDAVISNDSIPFKRSLSLNSYLFQDLARRVLSEALFA